MADVEQKQKEDEVTDSTSEICVCGPAYDEDTVRNNQLLRVPRVTTDPPSMLMIVAFTLFMIMVWIYSVDKGQYMYLLNGMDWRGKACGTGDLSTYTHQAWINPLMPNIWAGAICVKTCPAPANDEEVNHNEVTCICNAKYWPEKFGTSDKRSDALIKECGDDQAARLGYFTKVINAGDALHNDAATKEAGGTTTNDGVDQPCAYTYRTKWAMHKCVPWVSVENITTVVKQATATAESKDQISEWLSGSSEIFSTFMTDVAQSVHVLGACMALALVLILVCMVLLKYCVGFISKGILLALFVLFVIMSVVSYSQFDDYRARVDTVPQLSTHEQDKQSMYVWLSCFIAAIVLCLFHLAFTVYMYSEIDKALSIIKVASESFVHAPQILLYPMVHMLAFLFLLSFWLVGAILLYSAGDLLTDSRGVAYIEHEPGLRGAAFGYLYGLFWFAGFMNAMGYMIVAGTVYLCTFAQPKDPLFPDGDKVVPDSVMTVSACMVIRYHMGTAALGSLIFSVVWPFRIVTNIFGKLGNCENDLAKFACACCRCALWSWEVCFKYLNKMAYLQTVLHGYSFCGAAYQGLSCVMKGLPAIAPTTFISTSVLVVIKLTISLAVTGFADLLISSGKLSVTAEDLTYSWVPYFLVFFSTYIICTAFMLIIEVAIDAVMVAFCEAMYEEKGGIKEYQLPRSLREHMQTLGHLDEDAGMKQPLINKDAGVKREFS